MKQLIAILRSALALLLLFLYTLIAQELTVDDPRRCRAFFSLFTYSCVIMQRGYYFFFLFGETNGMIYCKREDTHAIGVDLQF